MSIYKTFRQVMDMPIYIGSLKDALDVSLLKEYNIKVVYNVCNDIDSPQFSEIRYIKFGLDDPLEGKARDNDVEMAARILNELLHLAAHIDSAILVHCSSGHNRSALVCAVWLNRYYRNYVSDFAHAVRLCGVKDKKNWMIAKGYDW